MPFDYYFHGRNPEMAVSREQVAGVACLTGGAWLVDADAVVPVGFSEVFHNVGLCDVMYR